MNSFYDFEAEDARCELHKMEEYRGKVVLVVNTATQCGFTQQYDDLQNIYEKYQEEGLEILDFPCNQFGNQAPGTNEEIVRRYKPFLDELDLTYTQYIAMMGVWEEKEINVKDLGKKLYLDSGTLTPLLKRLEQKGMVARRRDQKDERMRSAR